MVIVIGELWVTLWHGAQYLGEPQEAYQRLHLLGVGRVSPVRISPHGPVTTMMKSSESHLGLSGGQRTG
jgi:hypothetical protein